MQEVNIKFKKDNIPDKLRKLNQWVLWKLVKKKGSDKPTKIPYQTNNKPAVTTKSETWNSFENVYRTYSETPDVYSGIGFVFSDDDNLTGIDFDHVIDNKTKQIRTDVQELIDKFDSYTELSQSGTGCHIIVEGRKTMKRCKDSKLGYELYDKGRYFVFTGNPIHENLTIENRQKEIAEFEKVFAKKETPKPAINPTPIDVSLSGNAVIEKARKAKNGQKFSDLYSGNYKGHFSSQSEADLALCNMIAFYTQSYNDIDSLFRQSGLMRDKWNEKRGEMTYGQMTISKAISNLSATYQPQYNKATKELPRKQTKPNGQNKPITKNTVIETPDDELLIDTRYVQMSTSGIWITGKQSKFPITDFAIIPKYMIIDKNEDVFWAIELKRHGEESTFIEIPNETYGSATKLGNELLRHQYIFQGKKESLVKFQAAIEKVPQVIRVDALGHNSQSEGYFFANACIKGKEVIQPDKFNIVSIDDKSYYMPYVNEDKRRFLNAKRFIFEDNNVTFNQWSKLIFKAHRNDADLPMAFYISSLFRDIAFDELHFFPILYVQGKRGSGKSAIIRHLTFPAGNPQHTVSLKSPNTAKSLPRLLAQQSNYMLWLDEYHNGVDKEIQGTLQGVWDGTGYETAAMSVGFETNMVKILATLALTSNYFPDDDIFFSRCVLVQKNVTRFAQEQREAFKKIKELEKQNLSCITFEILQHREFIKSKWKHYYKTIYNQLESATKQYDIENRYIENMTVLLLPAYVLLKYHKIQFTGLAGYHEKIFDTAVQTLIAQNNISESNSELLEFWSICQMGYEKEQIKNQHDFKFADAVDTETGEIIPKGLLIIRFTNLYTYYQKQAGFNKAMSSKDLRTKLKEHDAFIEEKPSISFQRTSFSADGADVETKRIVTSGMIFNAAEMESKFGIIFQ